MKSYRLVLVVTAIFILLQACRKDKPPYPPYPPYTDSSQIYVYPNYSHLEVGNYWVYQIYKIDSTNEVPTNMYDSVFIAKDTIIGKNKYYKMMKPIYQGANAYETQLLRDSLHYIIDHEGKIQFSSQDFTSVFFSKYYFNIDNIIGPSDSIGLLEKRMTEKNVSVFVPAGTFLVSTFSQVWTMHPFYHKYAPATRKVDTKYSKSVGVVLESMPFYLMVPTRYERRLIRYNKH